MGLMSSVWQAEPRAMISLVAGPDSQRQHHSRCADNVVLLEASTTDYVHSVGAPSYLGYRHPRSGHLQKANRIGAVDGNAACVGATPVLGSCAKARFATPLACGFHTFQVLWAQFLRFVVR